MFQRKLINAYRVANFRRSLPILHLTEWRASTADGFLTRLNRGRNIASRILLVSKGHDDFRNLHSTKLNVDETALRICYRRMFPTCRVSFGGLKSDGRYAVSMDIVPVDNKRYRYAYHRSSWLVAGKADPPAPARLYIHPDSPFTGDQLRNQVVSFEKVKLTNNDMDKHGQVSSITFISSGRLAYLHVPPLT